MEPIAPGVRIREYKSRASPISRKMLYVTALSQGASLITTQI